jgi:hypothetical protein
LTAKIVVRVVGHDTVLEIVYFGASSGWKIKSLIEVKKLSFEPSWVCYLFEHKRDRIRHRTSSVSYFRDNHYPWCIDESTYDSRRYVSVSHNSQLRHIESNAVWSLDKWKKKRITQVK